VRRADGKRRHRIGPPHADDRFVLARCSTGPAPFWPYVPPAQLYWPGVPPGHFNARTRLRKLAGNVRTFLARVGKTARKTADTRAIFGKVIVQRGFIA
jgi:hypothetical protein